MKIKILFRYMLLSLLILTWCSSDENKKVDYWKLYLNKKSNHSTIVSDFIKTFFTLTLTKKSIALPQSAYFITIWKTDNNGTSRDNQITIPTSDYYNYNYFIDWGDGTNDSEVAGEITHTYASKGTYIVKIYGDFPAIFFYKNSYWSNQNINNDAQKLLWVKQWGKISWKSMKGAFRGCKNMAITASDIPDLSNVTDMSYMFHYATTFNQDIGDWDISKITNMMGIFKSATSFNQNIGDWNVSNVTNMAKMFDETLLFNQPIGRWDVSNVTNMSYMFHKAIDFNQPIGTWNISNAISTVAMFKSSTTFNHEIGDWNVSNITNMSEMFREAIAFNKDIGNWDVSNVSRMSWMFDDATAFNKNIGDWNVSNVVHMDYMFYRADAFNKYIGDWDVSSVKYMNYMFYGATAFNQNIGEWNLSNIIDMSAMFRGVTLSTNNYSNTLLKWSTQSLKNSVYFDGGYSKYRSSIEGERQSIIDDFKWTIYDGGQE